MLTTRQIRQILIRQKDNLVLPERLVTREILESIMESFSDNRVLILSGMRRSGKSTILKHLMQMKKEHCYVNFEDEKFLEFQAKDFEMLNEALMEVYGESSLYFFDEIQNIEGFEHFVRRLQDEGKKIVLTGSNAMLLSREFGTKLTGRYKSFEVLPFSFREYLHMLNISYDKESVYLAREKIRFRHLFEEYLTTGGLAEYIINKDPDYIRTIYENILFKDIIVRYDVRKERTLKELVGLLTTNISRPQTYNSLKKTLGLGNTITVKEYIGYLVNSYLFFEMNRFDFSLRKQIALPKKVYIIDPAFHQLLGFNFSENLGRILENIVYLELRRKKKDLFYYQNGCECDFISRSQTKIELAIQVCCDLTSDNLKRETEGLICTLEKFGLKQGLILTMDADDDLELQGKTIMVRPVWRWMLEDKHQLS